MNKFLLLFTLLSAFTLKAFSTARLQIIHNSADANAALVDIYVNGSIYKEDVAFRTATAFEDVTSGVPLEIDITPANTSLSSSVFNTTVTLTNGETYVVIANGILPTSTGYSPSPNFELLIFTPARETSGVANETDVVVFHGASDAPTVDVVERGVGAGLIVDDLSYGEFTNYLELPSANFTLDVRTDDALTTVASYNANLTSFGGAAAVVVASGFLTPGNNNNGAAFGLYVALPTGGPLLQLPSVTASSGSAQVQVIHNSADAAADSVDVYINGSLEADNFAFRTATGFLPLPSEIDIEVAIAPKNSTSVADSLRQFNYKLADGEKYIIIANGTVQGSPTYNPFQPFNLYVTTGRNASGNANETDVMVFHGATDAPTVDVVERGVGAGLIINDLSYGEFTDYLDLPTADFTLDVRTSNSLTTVASYSAPLATLQAGGAAAVVVASGFLTPSNNNSGPAFGLYAALPSGGPLLQLPSATASSGSATVQVIHNSADAAADSVDIYINGSLEVDNFAFRNATGFLPLPSEIDIEIAIAPKNSASSADSLRQFNYKLADGEKYIIIANGTVQGSPTYNPFQPFNLYVYAPGRNASGNTNETDVMVFHGATDAPTVDVVERGVGAGLIIDDLSYGEFTGYLDLPTADFTLDVRTDDALTTVASYSAPLATLQAGGAAAVVVASGFLTPGNNNSGPAFGLYAALPSGGPLLQLPSATANSGSAQVQVIHNSADAAADSVDVYINGSLEADNFAFRTATGFLPLPSEIDIEVAIAPKNSTSVADSLRRFNYTLADGEKYIIVANGIVSATGYSPATPFNLYVYAPARTASLVAAEVDVLVFHGATDAPTVDVVETSVPAGTFVEDLSYGEFSNYLELPEINAVIDVRDETGTTTVATYSAPLASLNLAGNALTVLASGFLSPDDNSGGPVFGLYVADADGGELLALPSIPVNVANFETVISNITLFPNPTNNILTVAVASTDATALNFVVSDMLGRTVISNTMNITKGNQNLVMNVADLNSGIYQVKLSNANINKIISFSKN